MEQNYYIILGLSEECTEKDIKKAYHQKARELHPDKAATPEEREKFEQQFAVISKAYNVLKETEKRLEYDKQLKLIKEKPPELPKPQAFSVKKKDPPSQTDAMKNASSSKQASISSAERSKIAQKAFTKGVQLFNAQDYHKAIEFFDAAISNDDSNSVYFAKYAVCLIRCKKSFTKAVEFMQTAIEMDPYNIDYKMQLAEIYESAGTYTNAKKIYEDIIKWDSQNDKAKRRLAYLMLDEKKSESFFINLYRKIFKKNQV